MAEMRLIVPAHGIYNIYEQATLEVTQGCYDHEDILAFTLPIIALFIQVGDGTWDYTAFYWEDIVDKTRRDAVEAEIMDFVNDAVSHLVIFEPTAVQLIQRCRGTLILAKSTPMDDLKRGFIVYEIIDLEN